MWLRMLKFYGLCEWISRVEFSLLAIVTGGALIIASAHAPQWRQREEEFISILRRVLSLVSLASSRRIEYAGAFQEERTGS